MDSLTTGLAIVKLLRPAHWVKNTFVLAALFFSPTSLNPTNAATAVTGFLAFCAAAGATYAFNDIFDRERDRHHAEKKDRPVAAGILSPKAAAAVAAIVAVLALALAMTLDQKFTLIILLYLTLNAAYSMSLKHIPVIDVAIIAIGFILRIYAGGVLIGIAPSAWIVTMAGLLALFLALAKRRGRNLTVDEGGNGSGYQQYPPALLNIAIFVTLGGLVIEL